MEDVIIDRIRSHRDLMVWRKDMDLVDAVYTITEQFPVKEEYRLTSQLVRAAISVPANIAEGQGRATSRDFAHFLIIAKASLAEVDTHVEIALRRGHLSDGDAASISLLVDELSRMRLRGKIVTRGHRH